MQCNNGNRQALNVNIGELKRGKGEVGKKKRIDRYPIDSLVSYEILSSKLCFDDFRFSLQSKLPRADRYMDTIRPSEGLRKIGLAGANMKGTRAGIYEILWVQR